MCVCVCVCVCRGGGGATTQIHGAESGHSTAVHSALRRRRPLSGPPAEGDSTIATESVERLVVKHFPVKTARASKRSGVRRYSACQRNKR